MSVVEFVTLIVIWVWIWLGGVNWQFLRFFGYFVYDILYVLMSLIGLILTTFKLFSLQIVETQAKLSQESTIFFLKFFIQIRISGFSFDCFQLSHLSFLFFKGQSRVQHTLMLCLSLSNSSLNLSRNSN